VDRQTRLKSDFTEHIGVLGGVAAEHRIFVDETQSFWAHGRQKAQARQMSDGLGPLESIRTRSYRNTQSMEVRFHAMLGEDPKVEVALV
jgi:hypothetical protein